MVTETFEWVYCDCTLPEDTEKINSRQNDAKRHILFPAIIQEQFIPGSKKYIPLFHDGIKKGATEEYSIQG